MMITRFIDQKLYVMKDETFLIPMKYVDVVRQTRTSMNNASEHTLNDYWNEESDFSHPQKNGSEQQDSTI